MELALQFGWGMMAHTRALLREWGGGTVILSPRDLDDTQLRRLGKDIQSLGGAALVDPQFYLPHSDHERLVAHEYWPADYVSANFWTGTELEQLLRRLHELNREVGTAAFILPGLYAPSVSDDWLAHQSIILDEAERLGIPAQSRLVTVALGDSAVSSIDGIDRLLEASRKWSAKGVYLICEHPKGDYLVQDPNWLANVVDLVAGWRLMRKEVTLGYASHLNLIVSAGGATAIASGTWMNVRSFPPDKFRANYDEEIKRRTTWYYAPATLSEFKIPFLDVAVRQGLLEDVAPTGEFRNPYSSPLFEGAQPTEASFSEQDAFRHYLHCLRIQTGAARKESFDATRDHLRATWDKAESKLERLHRVDVSGQMRDFGESIDACRAALALIETTRGAVLRREWDLL